MFTREVMRALPRWTRSMRGRRLVLVDIENAYGGAVRTEAGAKWVRTRVEALIGVRDSDQVIIGTSHVGLMPTYLGWCGARLLARSGPDGADLALLAVVESERVAERFDEVVLASGDGIFTEAVAALGAANVRVTIVAHVDGCAKRLRMAADRTILIDRDHVLGGVA